MTKVKTVTIPLPLYSKIKKRIDSTEFKDVNEYVTYVLEEVIKQVEEEEDIPEYSEEDEEKVKERLRALGYLD
jgi:Arc/MetJ-type ribon-helix-helix transcriptional regulator